MTITMEFFLFKASFQEEKKLKIFYLSFTKICCAHQCKHTFTFIKTNLFCKYVYM